MSLWRPMVGAELPQKWTDFNLSENTSDGNLICGNLNFIAASWNAAHSPIAILDINNPIRVPSNVPLIRAHKAYKFFHYLKIHTTHH